MFQKKINYFSKTADELKMKFRKELFNKISVVLFENKIKKNEYFGRDEFSNSVVVKTNENIVGQFKNIKILTGNQNSLKGEIYFNSENEEFAA